MIEKLFTWDQQKFLSAVSTFIRSHLQDLGNYTTIWFCTKTVLSDLGNLKDFRVRHWPVVSSCMMIPFWTVQTLREVEMFRMRSTKILSIRSHLRDFGNDTIMKTLKGFWTLYLLEYQSISGLLNYGPAVSFLRDISRLREGQRRPEQENTHCYTTRMVNRLSKLLRLFCDDRFSRLVPWTQAQPQ